MAISTLIPASAMNFTENQQACFVLEKLWSQREAGIFCDVVLHVQGQKFQAHRNVLAACSPYFNSVLKTHKVIKEQLTVTCQDIEAFQLLLNYMYTGAVVIDKNNVSELLRLSNHFLVSKLKSYCSEYLERYIDLSNCITLKDMAEKYNLLNLQKIVSLFIQCHMSDVLEQHDILKLPLEKIQSFLKEYQPCIRPQNMFTFICTWADWESDKREEDYKVLLSNLVFDTIDQQYHDFLVDHLKSCSLFSKSSKFLYYTLCCLEENGIQLMEFEAILISLKKEYENMNSVTEPEIIIPQNIDEAPVSSTIDEDTLVSVVPLEKGMKNNIDGSDVLDVKPGSDFEASNSSFDDVAPGGGTDIDYDDDSPTSEDEKPVPVVTTTPNRRKVTPRKLRPKTSSPQRFSMRKSTQIQKTVPPLKIARKSLGAITVKPFPKSSPKSAKSLKTPPKNAPSIKRKIETPDTKEEEITIIKKHYLSETDTSEDEDENDANSSGTDSSLDDSINGHGNKSKWKDGVKCPNCSYVAHSSVRLEQHVARIHAKDITYKCKECDFTCKWNREYYLHMKTHFQGPPFKCETCEYTCDRIQFLLSHRMRHTDERPFKCDECDHRCRTKANLDCHMRCHTGEKPYQCEHCERRFAIKASLDQHLASHREDRPFLCDTCGFSTKYQSHLFSHKRIHTGDVFRCHFPNCKYSTPKKSQLGSHHRTHTAVRSHICSICGRAFIEKSHLVRHERIHLNDKPFKCEHCDYCSSRRDKLKEHFRKHHSENATAKSPYRPRKQRRGGSGGVVYDMGMYSPPPKNPPPDENPLQHQQHIELQSAVSVIGSNIPSPTTTMNTHVVYSYETTPQDALHSHAAVALQQLGAAAAHNYQVAFMEQRHHQPHHHHHHHHHQHAHQHPHVHTHVGPTPPSAVPAIMTDQNRVNVVTVSSHDGTNVVGQPTEFSPFMSFM